MNLSCWGRCDEPCGEGAAARVRTPQGRHPPLPRHKRPQGGGRRSCSTPPPPLPHFPGPCLQLLARPPPSLPAPASSSEAEGGWISDYLHLPTAFRSLSASFEKF